MQHLTLEQCRKLKEIGFPQDTEKVWARNGGMSTGPTERFDGVRYELTSRLLVSHEDRFACPTLEELLEWLVPGPLELEYYSDHWHAIWTPYNTEETMHTTCADTPLIAVYNLAVALHSSPDTMGSHP